MNERAPTFINVGWTARRWLWRVWVVLAALGCTLTYASSPPTAVPAPLTPTITPYSRPITTAEWEIIAPGIERREIRLPTGSLAPQAVVLRFDPGLVAFRVHYSPGMPHSLDEWRALLPDATVIVNAGFFDEADLALGLVAVDGQFYGQTYAGFGGMFQITSGGARVRSLVSEPYYGDVLQQAVQSYPMLLEPGGILAPQGPGFDQRSRRTIIAEDRAGRIILTVVPYGLVSFAELQQWLLESDLGIYSAFALDGGRSTGMDLKIGGLTEKYPAFSRLPTVIAVYVP